MAKPKHRSILLAALLASAPLLAFALRGGDSPGRDDSDPRHVRILLSVREAGRHQVDLYDVAGKHVRRLHDAQLPEGCVAIRWDGRNSVSLPLPSGRYQVRLDGDSVGSVRLLR